MQLATSKKKEERRATKIWLFASCLFGVANCSNIRFPLNLRTYNVLYVCAHALRRPAKPLETHLFICMFICFVRISLSISLYFSFFLFCFLCEALFFLRMLDNVQSNLRISFGERRKKHKHTHIQKDSVTMRRFFLCQLLHQQAFIFRLGFSFHRILFTTCFAFVLKEIQWGIEAAKRKIHWL